MRTKFPDHIEDGRVLTGHMQSEYGDTFGAFHLTRVRVQFVAIASSGDELVQWEHVSVRARDYKGERVPTWAQTLSDDHAARCSCQTAPTPKMKPEFLIGKIACAYVLPDQVQRGIVQPKAEKIVGAVTASKDLPDSQPGGVPNRQLTIRGQSGRVQEVDLLRNWVQLFDTWDEANAAKATP